MEQIEFQDIASQLHYARQHQKPIPQWSSQIKMTRTDAYMVFQEGIKLRLKEGETLVGFKMGLTSEAKRKQMSLDSPLFGALTNKMQVPNQGELHLNQLIHPKVEPEIAFKLKKPITTELSYDNAIDCIAAIAPSLEILDSRYEQFKYFSMEDVVSDNSSSSHFVLGQWSTGDYKNLKSVSLDMIINGDISQSGTLEAISGDPINSLVEFSKLLQGTEFIPKEGDIILAGAATPAVALEPGMTVELTMQGFNPVKLKIAE